jgi:hypothetical protein
MLALVLTSTTSASSGFLAGNSCREKNVEEGEVHRAWASVSAETHRVCDEFCSRSAAGSVVAPNKIATPKVKQSPFGPKIEDEIPKNGVPKNWSKANIEEAIDDYQRSIASRKSEQRAYELAGRGNEAERIAHAQRISAEESFLHSLQHALENLGGPAK